MIIAMAASTIIIKKAHHDSYFANFKNDNHKMTKATKNPNNNYDSNNHIKNISKKKKITNKITAAATPIIEMIEAYFREPITKKMITATIFTLTTTGITSLTTEKIQKKIVLSKIN